MIEITSPEPKMTVKIRYQEYPGGPWHESDMREVSEEEYQGMFVSEVKPCPKYQMQD